MGQRKRERLAMKTAFALENLRYYREPKIVPDPESWSFKNEAREGSPVSMGTIRAAKRLADEADAQALRLGRAKRENLGVFDPDRQDTRQERRRADRRWVKMPAHASQTDWHQNNGIPDLIGRKRARART